jgi:hypothetical protein
MAVKSYAVFAADGTQIDETMSAGNDALTPTPSSAHVELSGEGQKEQLKRGYDSHGPATRASIASYPSCVSRDCIVAP